jgi:hypothetical protein
VPKRTIDELLAAMDAVELLKNAIARHDTALQHVLDRLISVERRLATLEDGRRDPPG